MKTEEICNYLNELIPNPKCELVYNKDYELLIAVMLSAQCTDKRVNIVTDNLFKKYTIKDLANIDTRILEQEIKSLGSYTKKASYIKGIAFSLIKYSGGKVPNDRLFLESLPGVGRKTCNVVLSEIFDIPTIAVDTHVKRVSIRLGLCKKSDSLETIEKKISRIFPVEIHNRINHQLLLFGRYTCKATNPKCSTCPFQKICKEKFTKLI